MNTIEKIVKLIKEKRIDEKTFLRNIGLNRSTLSDWKRGQSQSYKSHIEKIADYFDVSIDYLYGRTENPQSHKIKG